MQTTERGNQITIRDVANLAGVSIATVSRIINGKDSVSPVLTQKVLAAMEQLRYHPNAVAKALKRSESHSIGLIIPDIENPYFPGLVRGVEDAAHLQNYAVILCNTDGKPEKEQKYINFLLEKRVDGILYAGGIGSSIRFLEASPAAVVLLDRHIDCRLDRVVTDNRLGAFLVVEHLINSGRKRIAYIGGPSEFSTVAERFDGYRDALAAYQLAFDENLVTVGDFSLASGWRAIAELLARAADIDAVFAANDLMAIGVIQYLDKQGVKTPDAIAVAGFDDIPLAAWYQPALTTIRQPVYDLGQHAVRMLLERKNHPYEQCKEKRLKPQLIVRCSTGRRT